ncbi:MAG: hypothetical protein LW865_02170 [Betaproteobacteria bacterium]|nr:hypothetical protein [Rhodocyclaceae bacterium]MCE2722082.1 hypothetical protein [Betaproteobacteria bacterium]
MKLQRSSLLTLSTVKPHKRRVDNPQNRFYQFPVMGFPGADKLIVLKVYVDCFEVRLGINDGSTAFAKPGPTVLYWQTASVSTTSAAKSSHCCVSTNSWGVQAARY